MADPEQRERESQEDPETKYDREREREQATEERVAEEIKDAPLSERDDG
jgi:hypothetical protein